MTLPEPARTLWLAARDALAVDEEALRNLGTRAGAALYDALYKNSGSRSAGKRWKSRP